MLKSQTCTTGGNSVENANERKIFDREIKAKLMKKKIEIKKMNSYKLKDKKKLIEIPVKIY